MTEKTPYSISWVDRNIWYKYRNTFKSDKEVEDDFLFKYHSSVPRLFPIYFRTEEDYNLFMLTYS